jgi:POT family proton-dependent oligopeptide transporter
MGHPRGLAVLCATEAWERFSYFGNSALLVLYMVQYLLRPGIAEGVLGLAAVKAALEFFTGPLAPQPLASQLFGIYTGLAYCTPVLGGLVADRLLGQRRTVLAGGMLMAAGHFLIAFETLLLIGLLLLILGIGAFKPNISTQVGALYSPDDRRRDRAFSLFYVGINVGAFLAPLACGALAAKYGWHYGFGAAGIGMLLSLAVYLAGARFLPPDRMKLSRMPTDEEQGSNRNPSTRRSEKPSLGSAERRSVVAILATCATLTLFWAAYDQQANTLVLWIEDFADRAVDIGIWRGEIPATWFLALNPLFIFVLTPVLVRRWARQGESDVGQSPFRKMAFGAACLALANMVMAIAAFVEAGKANPLWLVGYFGLATLGELHIAPIGLAFISKRAPAHLLSLLMGVWFATTLPADLLAGYIGGFWSSMASAHFFLLIAMIAVAASLALRLQGAMIGSLHR